MMRPDEPTAPARPPRRRPVESVRALEELQRQERETSGLVLPDNPRAAIEEVLRRQYARRAVDHASASVPTGFTENFIHELVKQPSMAPEFEARLQERVNSIITELALDDPQQWSRFEYPWAVIDIARATRGIEDAVDRYRASESDPERAIAELSALHDGRWDLPLTPVVGTLNTGQITAQLQLTPEGYPLILIQSGLFKFADTMAALALVGSSDYIAHGAVSSATLQLAADLAASHCVLGTTIGVYSRTLPTAFEDSVPVVGQCITSFVLAHEYAHVIRGDVEVHRLGSAERDADAVAEFESDYLGLLICLLAERRPGFEGAPVFGALLYLAGLDFLARVEATFERQELPHPDGDYPTSDERVSRLLDRLEASWLGGVLGQAVAPAIDLYRFVQYLTQLLVPVIVQARDDLTSYIPTETADGYSMEMLHGAAVESMWRHCKSVYPSLR